MRAALLLWLGALAVSAVTLDRLLDPFDEGLLLLGAQRMAAGELPYADFQWAYGPGHLLPQWAWFELAGPSVVPWRVLRAIADASAALLVAVTGFWRPDFGAFALLAVIAALVARGDPSAAAPRGAAAGRWPGAWR